MLSGAPLFWLRKGGGKIEGNHPTSSCPTGPSLMYFSDLSLGICTSSLEAAGSAHHTTVLGSSRSECRGERLCAQRTEAGLASHCPRAVGVLPWLQHAAALEIAARDMQEQCLVLECTTARTGLLVQAARSPAVESASCHSALTPARSSHVTQDESHMVRNRDHLLREGL